MKFHWEESDIICGRIVCKPPSYQNRQTFEADGNSAKWTQKIGFVRGSGEGTYVLIAMTDGMVGKPKTKAELASDLNKDELIPMPHKWLLEIINWLRDSYAAEQ